jgi:pimeloyl-ACP methyl ester carboxylesterase
VQITVVRAGGFTVTVTTDAAPVRRDTAVAGLSLAADVAGAGRPLVVIHHSTGPLWTPYLERASESRQVVALHLAGFGRSERPSAARAPSDLAVLAMQHLDALALDPLDIVGLGFGGWVAAEMAAMYQRRFTSLTLVGAAGLKPAEGFIHDPMMTSFEAYVRQGFARQDRFTTMFGETPAPEIVELWDFSREMTARLTWKKWMWSTSLPALVRGVRIPAQVIWGDDDQVVPLSCGQDYAELLGGVALHVVPDAGHNIDLEQPDELARLTTASLTSERR